MHTPLIQGYEKILGSNGLKCPFYGMKPIKQSQVFAAPLSVTACSLRETI